jgi:O-acetyl-ADP-ribose deacetylase (regulator of RNase III)
MPLEIIRGDITKVKADAIVNAANSRLAEGGGVCGAIFRAAGAARLRAECEKIGYCPVGGAVITSGFDLPASFVIHTVGPVWQGGAHDEERLLKSCYKSALELASKYGCRSVAFPLISSGIFGYPYGKALEDAKAAIGEFLEGNELTVYLVLYG